VVAFPGEVVGVVSGAAPWLIAGVVGDPVREGVAGSAAGSYAGEGCTAVSAAVGRAAGVDSSAWATCCELSEMQA
jgi:hypothetical protein